MRRDVGQRTSLPGQWEEGNVRQFVEVIVNIFKQRWRHNRMLDRCAILCNFIVMAVTGSKDKVLICYFSGNAPICAIKFD